MLRFLGPVFLKLIVRIKILAESGVHAEEGSLALADLVLPGRGGQSVADGLGNPPQHFGGRVELFRGFVDRRGGIHIV